MLKTHDGRKYTTDIIHALACSVLRMSDKATHSLRSPRPCDCSRVPALAIDYNPEMLFTDCFYGFLQGLVGNAMLTLHQVLWSNTLSQRKHYVGIAKIFDQAEIQRQHLLKVGMSSSKTQGAILTCRLLCGSWNSKALPSCTAPELWKLLSWRFWAAGNCKLHKLKTGSWRPRCPLHAPPEAIKGISTGIASLPFPWAGSGKEIA